MTTEAALRELKALLDGNNLSDTPVAEGFLDILKKMATNSANSGLVSELKGFAARIASDPNGALKGAIDTVSRSLANSKLAELPVKLGIQTDLTKFTEQAQSFLSAAGSQLKLGINFVLDDKTSILSGLQNMTDEIKGSSQYKQIFDKMDAGDVFKNAAFAGVRTKLTESLTDSVIGKGANAVDDTMSFSLNKYRDAAIERTQYATNPFGTDTYEDNLRSFQNQTSTRQRAFGQDGGEALKEIASMTNAIDNIKAQLGEDFQIKFGDNVLDSASALSVFSKELGIGESQMASYVNFLTTRFDGSSKNLEENLLNIAKGASAAGMPIQTFMRDISDITEQYKDLGDVTQVATQMSVQFAQALGPNRLGLARETMKQVQSGIAGMSDEMKAFLSMGNSLGGGGGAIESIVNLEEAIASGDQGKIKEIQDEALARIEELSGGGLLTRQEAVDSGQQDLFYRQSALSEQMGLTRGRNQFSAFVEGSRGGEVDLASMQGDSQIIMNRYRDNQIRGQGLVDTMANTSYGIAEGRMTDANIVVDRTRLAGGRAATGLITGDANTDPIDLNNKDSIIDMIHRALTGNTSKLPDDKGIAAMNRTFAQAAMEQHSETANTFRLGAQANFKEVTGTARIGAQTAAQNDQLTNAQGAIEANAQIREIAFSEISAPMLESFSEITESINSSNEKQMSKLDEQINAINALVKSLVDQKVQINLSPEAGQIFDKVVSAKLKSSLG